MSWSPESLYAVKKIKSRGKGLVARRNLDPDNCIIEEPSDMAILDNSSLEDTCDNCFAIRGRPMSYPTHNPYNADEQERTKFLRCGGCGVVKYCNQMCQKVSWSDHHKRECPIFSRLRPKILPTLVRACIRLLLRGPVPSTHDIFHLETHEDDFRNAGGSKWEDICLMAKAAKEYSGTPQTEQYVISLLCRILINCITLMSVTNDPLGLALACQTARINHSCNYNAAVRFSFNGTVTVVPLRRIAEGKEITIAYIDCTMPYLLRQEELRKRYFFSCTCKVCKDGTKGRLDRLKNDQVWNTALIEVEQKAIGLLESARNDTGSSAPIRKLRYGLHLCHNTGVWPLHRYPYSALRNDLIFAYLKAQQYHLAIVQAAIRYRRIDPDLMPNKGHPIRLVNALILLELIDHIGLHTQWVIQKETIYGLDLNLQVLNESVMQYISDHLETACHHGAFYQKLVTKRDRFIEHRSWQPRDREAEKKEWIKFDELLDKALDEEAIWEKE